MKTGKLANSIVMVLLAMGILIVGPRSINSVPDTHGANCQWVALIQGICILGIFLGGYGIYLAIKQRKDASLAWEELTSPPTEQGNYLVRFDAEETPLEVVIRSDGGVYEKTMMGPINIKNKLTGKSMEWVRVRPSRVTANK